MLVKTRPRRKPLASKQILTKPEKKAKEKKITKQKAMQIISIMKQSRWKLTLTELAKRTGISKSSISLVLNQYLGRKN